MATLLATLVRLFQTKKKEQITRKNYFAKSFFENKNSATRSSQNLFFLRFFVGVFLCSFRSIIRSSEQIINGNVEHIGKFHKVFEAGLCFAVFITDIRRLRYAQTFCNLTLSESFLCSIRAS